MPIHAVSGHAEDLSPRIVVATVVFLVLCFAAAVLFAIAGVAPFEAVSGVLAGI
jgi:hypothetical protein